MLFLLPILTLPALLSVFFAGYFGPDAHVRFGYLASFTSLVGLPYPHFPGPLLPLAELELFPGFTHSVFAPLAVYCAKSFEVIPHPVLFSPHIPAPNLAQNISSYQPWLHALVDVDDIYVPAQFPIFEAALDFNFLFILPVAEFKLWLFAHFLGLIAVAACCPYFDLFGCNTFSSRRISLPKKMRLKASKLSGRPFFTSVFGPSYPYPCLITIPTTRNCLPIQIEITDTTSTYIHPSPSDLELDSCISPSYSETYLNKLELSSSLCFEKPVDSDRITIKEAKLENCTSGLLPFEENFCQNELISSTLDGDTRDLEANDANGSFSNKSVWEHITTDCDLKAVIEEVLIDESDVGMSKASHSNIITTKQKYEEPVSFLTSDNTLTNAAIGQPPEIIPCLSSAVELSYLEKEYKSSCCIEMKLERQIKNGDASEVKQNNTDGSVEAISSSSLPILMESSSGQIRTAISNVDPVINHAEQTSESESLLNCNLTECEVKVKRKRGCRGGVKVHKRAAARQQAATKKELECTIVETDHESSEHDKESYVTAEDNLLVLDSPSDPVVPQELDTPDLPKTSEIETVEPELEAIKSTAPVYIKEGKMFKPGYVRKRGCRGKKSSKRKTQLSCDDPPPIQLHSDS